jgi:hypothetical protein
MSVPNQGRNALGERYVQFAEDEARGNSPLYENIAVWVSRSGPVLAFLATLPPQRQQPNLFLAALRQVAGLQYSQGQLESAIADHGREIAEVMLRKTTQTNECGRCAVLLPVLARLRQPLAILEVGAAAGLCLFPDLYGYDYGKTKIDAPRVSLAIAPVLRCEASLSTPLPERLPEVVWRAGLDINPLSVASPDDICWLRTLVWPEQSERLARLNAAIAVAEANQIHIQRGDLSEDLPPLAFQAPASAQLVVFHTAVLTYVPDLAIREAFARTVRDLGAIWISNEFPDVFPSIAARAGTKPAGKFLLSVNGTPMAWTAPHGQWMDWLPEGDRLR